MVHDASAEQKWKWNHRSCQEFYFSKEVFDSVFVESTYEKHNKKLNVLYPLGKCFDFDHVKYVPNSDLLSSTRRLPLLISIPRSKWRSRQAVYKLIWVFVIEDQKDPFQAMLQVLLYRKRTHRCYNGIFHPVKRYICIDLERREILLHFSLSGAPTSKISPTGVYHL
ncbi:hypothetical protein RCL_jg2090.t1 [Rhizophagus clarus]|uniref:Uncharacterized protein n=1 Tax=Rhizophagus clarus TaxID=94130 RepID=A0A8H3KQK6_9GLOM|nr:hypothetical protein RCL_jg2090.t1 [Rhizophagus clarus]